MALTTSSYIVLAFWRLGLLFLVERRGLEACLFLRCFDDLDHHGFGFGWVGSELLCYDSTHLEMKLLARLGTHGCPGG